MTNPEVQQRLSESEVEHARRYVIALAGSSMELTTACPQVCPFDRSTFLSFSFAKSTRDTADS